MRNAADIADFIAHNPRMMRCLAVLAAHGPAGAWIGAGFVRNAVWDHLSGQDTEATPLADLDVVFHDPVNATAEQDAAYEAALCVAASDLLWSVRNQARMHERNGHRPYRDVADALAHWPETATAIAARLAPKGVELLAPFGVEVMLAMIIRPTPAFRTKPEILLARLEAKGWLARWPRLRVVGLGDSP
ncbi:MAG: nucleotidyltransferase family protein [Alphaproteobacteria bacterium]|nr:nucleotidyltransferase family protein [Alphaproteobacteria bacterium]